MSRDAQNRHRHGRRLAQAMAVVRPVSRHEGIVHKALAEMTPAQATVLAALAAHSAPVRAADLAEELDMTVAELRRALGALRALRLVGLDRLAGRSGNAWSAL